MHEKIPVPLTFNPHKHHFQFLLNEIENWKKLEWKQVDQELVLIGENLLDFYTGFLTVENIGDEIIQFFKNVNISDKIGFSNWLHPFEYRKVELSDSSVWIIKKGNDAERFIHIHPAKQSPNTIRVRAATLKTVISLMIKNVSHSNHINETLQLVNFIRSTYLQLSPIKSLQRGKGIVQLWEIFIKSN